jgi:carboxyl-terminal processing protease
MMSHVVSLVAAASAMLSPASLGVQEPADLTPAEKVYGLSKFWSEAAHHFPFFDQVPDLDWDQAYREFLPRVLATTSKREYYDELRKFAALLKDGHTNVFPPRDLAATTITSPFGWDLIGKRLYVVNNFESLLKEIPVGSEIVAVRGVPLDEYLAANFFPWISSSTVHILWRTAVFRLLQGGPGERLEFTIVTPSGERRDTSITFGDRHEGEVVPPREHLRTEGGLVRHAHLGDGVQYVLIPTFADPKVTEEFDALLPTLAKAEGLIIDLRSNGGGNDDYALHVVRHFTRGSFKGFAWRTRETRSSYRAWGQDRRDRAPETLNDWEREVLAHFRGDSWFSYGPETYRGHPDARLLMPKVVLTGHGTASAAEDMLIFMQDIPNVTRVGGVTYGSTGQPYRFSLPGGGSARVVTMRVTYPDGTDFVGHGIPPHVEVVPSLAQLTSGKDFTLAKALEVLAGKRSRQ